MLYLKRFLVGIIALPISIVIGLILSIIAIITIPLTWALMVIWYIHDFGRKIIG